MQDFVVHVTEEFLEFISEGALAIEVWGHRCAGNGRSLWELDALEAKTQTLRDRYKQYLQIQRQTLVCTHMQTFHASLIIAAAAAAAFKVE